MSVTPVYSSSSVSAYAGLASSADEGINAIEENEARISTPSLFFFPELIEKILHFLITPYEPIKSILNLYAAQRINIIFFDSVVNFLKSPKFNSLKLAENNIFFLKNIKKLENDINEVINHREMEYNIKKYQYFIQKFAQLRYSWDEIDYRWNFMLKRSKNVCINFCKNKMHVSLDALEILSKRTNIENLSIIADITFSVNISVFLKNFKFIVNNNKNISKINYLSLQKSNINNSSAIQILGENLSGIAIVTLNLSHNNRISDKYAPSLAECIKTLKIDNLHLRGIGISSEGLQHILNALPKDLKYLDISYNYIEPRGMDFLLDKLRSSKIECVDLSENRLLKYSSNLKSITNEKDKLIKLIF